MVNLQEHETVPSFALMQSVVSTCYSEILDNIATVVKQFKPLLNVHKMDEFNGKMSYV